jgi:hypothetical protein
MRAAFDWHGGHAGVLSELEIRSWAALLEGDPCTRAV